MHRCNYKTNVRALRTNCVSPCGRIAGQQFRYSAGTTGKNINIAHAPCARHRHQVGAIFLQGSNDCTGRFHLRVEFKSRQTRSESMEEGWIYGGWI
jgi:hypothetical protein